MMKTIIAIVISGMIGFGASAQTAGDMPKDSKTNKFVELIVGSWKLQKIVDEQGTKSQENVGKTPDNGQNGMEMLEFTVENRYKVNNSTNAIDSGSFRMNEQHGILYMESDQDDITPNEYKITLNGGQLTLTGRDRDAKNRYKYVYQKTEEGVNTTNGLSTTKKRPTSR
jgi:hypothetical protein